MYPHCQVANGTIRICAPRHRYEFNFQGLLIRHLLQHLLNWSVDDTLGIEEKESAYTRSINQRLFADSSDELFSGSLSNVHSAENIFIPAIPLLFIGAKVNTER
jgi:hypothetical protein